MGDWLLPLQRSWGLRSSGMLHGVGRHFNWLTVENGKGMFSETSIISCQTKLSDIQEERRSEADKFVIVEGTYLFVYGRYRWGFGVLRLPEYNKFLLLLSSFSFVKLSFGRPIFDVLNYIFYTGVVMSRNIVTHLVYIWSVRWFCIAQGHLNFIHIVDKALLKWSSRHWCISFCNIVYRNWINFGLILLLLIEFFNFFLLIEISAFEWVNFCIRFKI
jgi:hypothetical protein